MKNFIDKFSAHELTQKLVGQLKNPQVKILAKGLVGSALSMEITAIAQQLKDPLVVVLNDKEEAAYILNDVEKFYGKECTLFFPASYRRPYEIETTDNANVLLRAEVFNHIRQSQKKWVIVTYSEAIFEKVITKKDIERNTLKLSVGQRINIETFNEQLFENQFQRVDFVSQPGEFSMRGGIIDVFSFANDHPFRIEFFGDEIDSIRTFDIESQLSIERIQEVSILSNIEQKSGNESRISFLDYLPEESIIITKNAEHTLQKLNDLFSKAEEIFQKKDSPLKHSQPEELFYNGSAFISQLQLFRNIEMERNTTFKFAEEIHFGFQPQPSFNKQFEWLFNHLSENTQQGISNHIFCTNASQAERFKEIFESIKNEREEEQPIDFQTHIQSIYQGFINPEWNIACYTDHQIFERYHRFSIKNGYSKKQKITLQELNTLNLGDYVTHIDHGIARFGGLHSIDVAGKKQEALKLIYADNDIVYVSIHSLHKISKFNGKDGAQPKIYKLGSGAWKKLKEKTKTRVKKIAFDLIQLYAKRRFMEGFACEKDSYLQAELESSFIYEDTPDQLTATEDVKADMEKIQPMDRLICGDVGFGKTEVAIRAAFKMVDNGKQVAVLVPTTILAFQHYKTFSERLKGMPVNIAYLNRFKTAKQKTETLKQLADGSLDIIIGTHQLTNKNVVFKDLGLLIIDEEQKFGVAVKDKLKMMGENIDTLTLTATPIPRTLQFSLMAARDLSVITTPPPNRYPIETQVVGFNEEIIRDGVMQELERDGQVFFIHNRIENIKEIAGMIQRLVPQARIAIGHGQLEGKKLEKLLLDFMDGAYDVLVATTIIESGLDVPNANTIFINQAQNFGLSDLHQMRGRVGRSNKKAFCYYICPPYSAMTEDARKRMQALEQFSELGSGFQIAMKDLEIRGAGDLLGGEQSGFINEIGFETYQKIMNEALEELKENECKDIYAQSEQQPKTYVKDLILETDFEMLLPSDYVNSTSERMRLYNEMNDLKTSEEVQQFHNKLTDRFGTPPEPVQNLLISVQIKQLATDLGIEKVVLKNKKMVLYFVSDPESTYYQTDTFENILNFVKTHPHLGKMKEKETIKGLRLLYSLEKIDTLDRALEILQKIKK